MILAMAALMVKPRKLALFTKNGTAMKESGICSSCYQNDTRRGYAREWGLMAADYDGQEFHDVTDNDEIECQFCGRR